MSLRPLSKKLQEKAEKELNEVPSRIQQDLDHLKEWISKQHFSHIKKEDQWLLSHLRGCKFSLQQAKQKYAVNCEMRMTIPEYFENRDPFQPEIQEFLKRSILVSLPASSELEPGRFLIQFKYSDPEKLTLTTFFKMATVIADITALEDDACIINGQELVFDLDQLPYNYFAQITPFVIKNAVTIEQNAYGTRMKGIHFINVPSILYTFINMFKTLLSEKIRNRVHFYSKNDLEELYQLIPKSSFPEEYGGNAGPSEKLSNALKLRVEGYSEWFKLDSQCSLKQTAMKILKTSSDILGMEGSFRKLNID